MNERGSSGLGNSKWLLIGALVVAVLMGIGRVGSGLIDQTGSDIDCSEAIAWNDAASYAGEQRTVRGPVVDTTYAESSQGQPTFLNLGRAYPDPDRFTVVIWRDTRTSFDQRPEFMFAGQEVCVTGEIQMYEGSPEIELPGRNAIEIVQ